MSLVKLLIYAGYLFLFINTLIYLFQIKGSYKTYRIFTGYLVFISIIQFINWFLAENKIDNLYLSHYYFIGQFIWLSFFFRSLISNSSYKKGIVFIASTIVVYLVIEYLLWPEKYFKFNLSEIILCSIPIVLYSILFFFQSMASDEKKYLFINSGIFLYLLCSTLIFVAGNYVSPKQTFWNQFIWFMNSLLYIVYLILIFVEWYKNFRKGEATDLN